ncbi:MAG: hypothetical protein Q8R85_21280 [Bosea sp. (in: a-proteobacteria)]|uniref:hypothetical protein n=1 Tax=Bosea sp. (in: a-proteobacteria) TaxID=1871050 RepID=UPI0027331CEE|nr:hypothetical protein [Bosea sp. (in: a-proteobacteria)]MDP3603701.1 hypothetical protein [Bosea sp. (in: a-proteobacteria)]
MFSPDMIDVRHCLLDSLDRILDAKSSLSGQMEDIQIIRRTATAAVDQIDRLDARLEAMGDANRQLKLEVRNIASKHSECLDTLRETNAANVNLKSDYLDICARLIAVEAENSDFKINNSELIAARTELESIVKNVSSRNVALDISFRDALSQLRTSEAAATASKQLIMEYRSKLETQTDQVALLEEQVDDLSRRANERLELNQRLQAQLSDTKNRLSNMSNIVGADRLALSSLRADNETLLRERDEQALKWSAIEAAMRSKIALLERMEAAARERHKVESDLHTGTRREKAQIDVALEQAHTQMGKLAAENSELKRVRDELEARAQETKIDRHQSVEIQKRQAAELGILNQQLVEAHSHTRLLEHEISELKEAALREREAGSEALQRVRNENRQIRNEMNRMLGLGEGPPHIGAGDETEQAPVNVVDMTWPRAAAK